MQYVFKLELIFMYRNTMCQITSNKPGTIFFSIEKLFPNFLALERPHFGIRELLQIFFFYIMSKSQQSLADWCHRCHCHLFPFARTNWQQNSTNCPNSDSNMDKDCSLFVANKQSSFQVHRFSFVEWRHRLLQRQRKSWNIYEEFSFILVRYNIIKSKFMLKLNKIIYCINLHWWDNEDRRLVIFLLNRCKNFMPSFCYTGKVHVIVLLNYGIAESTEIPISTQEKGGILLGSLILWFVYRFSQCY